MSDERDSLLAELDELVAVGEARRDGARDPFLIGIRPAAADWMTADEIHRLYSRGDVVAVYSRGSVRDAIVVETTKTRVEVAYTTPTALREARERRESHPDTSPTVTRKTVKPSDLYNLRPATASPTQTTPEEETPMPRKTQTAATTSPRRATRSRSATTAPAATQELPKKDAEIQAPPSGADLETSIRDRIAALVKGVEFVAPKAGGYCRVRLQGKTLGYLTPSRSHVRVEVPAIEGNPTWKVATLDDAEPAIATFATAAKEVAAK